MSHPCPQYKRDKCWSQCRRPTNCIGYCIEAYSRSDGWVAISETYDTRCEADKALLKWPRVPGVELRVGTVLAVAA